MLYNRDRHNFDILISSGVMLCCCDTPETCRHLDTESFSELDNENTSFHGIDENVTALEQSIARPRANEVDLSTSGKVVILRIDI